MAGEVDLYMCNSILGGLYREVFERGKTLLEVLYGAEL